VKFESIDGVERSKLDLEALGTSSIKDDFQVVFLLYH